MPRCAGSRPRTSRSSRRSTAPIRYAELARRLGVEPGGSGKTTTLYSLLAQVNDEFAEINSTAQGRYRAGLATLIHAARPGLTKSECGRRAADIDVLQNGVWLTSLLGLDRSSIRRSVARSEEIALGDRPDD